MVDGTIQPAMCSCLGPIWARHKARKRSEEIDKFLAMERKSIAREIKILFLGAPRSGRNSVLEMFSFVYRTISECAPAKAELVSAIRNFLVKSGKLLCETRRRLGIPCGDPVTLQHEALILDAAQGDVEYFQPLANALERVWADRGIQEAFGRSREWTEMVSLP